MKHWKTDGLELLLIQWLCVEGHVRFQLSWSEAKIFGGGIRQYVTMSDTHPMQSELARTRVSDNNTLILSVLSFLQSEHARKVVPNQAITCDI